MCNAYINNLMHTCNAYKYLAKITWRMITHMSTICKSLIFFHVKFFFLLLLLFLCSFYHHNKLPLPGKLYHSMFAGPSRKTFHFYGMEVCLVSGQAISSTSSTSSLPPLAITASLTVTFLAVGRHHQALSLS